MYYGGINAHRTYLTVAITHKEGVLIEEHGRVPIGDGEPILKALDEFRPLEVVVETCPFWPWIYDVLEPTDIGFHLAHASELEAIANAETKTYSVDARLLARRRGPEARAGRPGTEAPRREPIGGCEEPWCRRSPSHMRSTPDSSLGSYYERQKERIGWQKAREATARKLCRVIYAMLSTGEVWRG